VPSAFCEQQILNVVTIRLWLQMVKEERQNVNMEVDKELFLFACLFVVVFSNVNLSLGDGDKNTNLKKKLQIGVKKRVDNCQVKSKKGDFLHMHYRVSANVHFLSFYRCNEKPACYMNDGTIFHSCIPQ